MLRGRSSNRMSVWMFFLLVAAPGLAGAGTLELISGTNVTADSFGTSEFPALSADGRYVAFISDAPNLVPGQEDDNNTRDVFLHDRILGTTTLVSHVPGSPTRTGGPAQFNTSLEVSADGRYVAFVSSSADLAPGAGDNGSDVDVFLWDRITGATTLVSHAAGAPGTAAAGSSFAVHMSRDGNFLVLLSNASNLVPGQVEPAPNARTTDVFLWSRASDTMTLVSRRGGTTAGTSVIAADQPSLNTAISDDGNVVVFTTLASDLLLPSADSNTFSDVYAYERSTDTLSLVSRAATVPQLAVGASHEIIAVSGAGRYVAFASTAANLVPGQLDTNSTLDVFLYDRTTGEMRLVSHRSASPLLAGGIFGDFSMSAGGRYVAFSSSAPDLVPGQVDPLASHLSVDVFVWDRLTDLIALASHSRDSVTTAGAPGATDTSGTSGSPRLSADGRFLLFHSTSVDLVHGLADAPNTVDIFLYDQTTRGVTLVSRSGESAPGLTSANGHSFSPVLSADGSVAAFISEATDLGEGQNDPHRFRDLFLYHRTSGDITSPSRRAPGLPLPLTSIVSSLLSGLSGDGRFVGFERDGSYLRDAVADTTLRLMPPSTPTATRGPSLKPVLSADGRFAAFISVQYAPGYAEGLFLYEVATGTYTLANHAPGSATQIDGFASSFALSADGRYVAYQCSACGLVPGHPGPVPGGFEEIFLYDRLTGLNTLVSRATNTSLPAFRADGRSFSPAISADGRYVAFWSTATNLFPGQADASATLDLFVFDREAGSVELVTQVPGSPARAAGLPGVSFPDTVHLSADGRFIAFRSALPNLVPGQVDANGSLDFFLHDRTADTTVLVSHAASSEVTEANQQAYASSHEDSLSMSIDGRFIVYESLATDLVEGLVAGAEAPNGVHNVFLYDRLTGTNSLVSHAAGTPLKTGNEASEVPRISADGSTITFLSGATDLAAGQAVQHVFPFSRSLYVHDRSTGTTAFAAEALKFGRPFNLFPSDEPLLFFAPQISADGRRVAFTSDSALVPGDYNRTWDVYLWEETVEPEDPGDPGDPEGPVSVPPCRLLDTRRRAERPILTSNVQRTVTAHGRCEVPDTAKQVLVKVTVFNPSGKGNLRFYAGDVTAPPSAILRFERGTGRTEMFTLPLSPNGTLTILPFVAGRGTVHGAVEVTAYEN